jgi:hypothetical protein
MVIVRRRGSRVFQLQNLGTLKGQYQFLRALFLPNCVCRHRSISITYDSLLPCHGSVLFVRISTYCRRPGNLRLLLIPQ